MLDNHICGVCLVALAAAAAVALAAALAATASGSASAGPDRPAIRGSAVRYQVADVDRSIAFYTEHLDFRVEQSFGAAFARISNGPLVLYLSGPKSSGSRPMPDGRRQEPGGWNRIVLEVSDLPAQVAMLKHAHVRFRNEIVTGPGGKQVQIEDPDGNPVELFEPAPPAPLSPVATQPKGAAPDRAQ
jgi:glyoxylase I family protein